jgi:hypothetical protein
VEKERLVSEYETTTSGFAASLTELQRRMGVCSKEEYERLHREVDEARVKSEQARLTLEQHVAAHGC